MFLILLLNLLLLSPSPKLDVSPRFSSEPTIINFRVSQIVGDVVCAVLDGPTYYSSSCTQLFPDETRKGFKFRDVPAGVYQAFAVVDGKTRSQSYEVIVTSTGPG